jgi:hypothetical protein
VQWNGGKNTKIIYRFYDSTEQLTSMTCKLHANLLSTGFHFGQGHETFDFSLFVFKCFEDSLATLLVMLAAMWTMRIAHCTVLNSRDLFPLVFLSFVEMLTAVVERKT